MLNVFCLSSSAPFQGSGARGSRLLHQLTALGRSAAARSSRDVCVCVCVCVRESACSPLRFGSEATAGARESKEGEVHPPLHSPLSFGQKKEQPRFLRQSFVQPSLPVVLRVPSRAPSETSPSQRRRSSVRPELLRFQSERARRGGPLLSFPLLQKKGKGDSSRACLFFSSFFSFRVNKEAFASFFSLKKQKLT